ncbi:MAG TPA: carbohydrate ABC transporter permease [Anaerolineae bacterium]|nr:carbohydrate ABC transporter permease [Anaerolineae bacterium]
MQKTMETLRPSVMEGIHPRRWKISTTVFYLILIAYGLINLFPFVWVVLSSFKTNDEIYAAVLALPSQLRFENYVTAWQTAKIGQFMLNSAIVSASAVFIVLLFGSMAAYILSRVIPNRFLYTYFALGIMIPVQTILIPTFVLMKTIQLNNTLLSLILLYAASNISLAVFLLVGFMRSIPGELEEAAVIDGCSWPRLFFQIILPLCRPGLAAVGTLSFLYCWNEYLFAYVLISGADTKTMPQGIYALQGLYTAAYGPLTAGLVLSILPVLIIYILFQEQVIEGMVAGSVVG